MELQCGHALSLSLIQGFVPCHKYLEQYLTTFTHDIQRSTQKLETLKKAVPSTSSDAIHLVALLIDPITCRSKHLCHRQARGPHLSAPHSYVIQARAQTRESPKV
jgi:hypothetical protein